MLAVPLAIAAGLGLIVLIGLASAPAGARPTDPPAPAFAAGARLDPGLFYIPAQPAPQIELTASDGEARVIGAGEIVLVEDVTGKGHLSRSVNNQMRHSIFVPIE